MSNRSLSKCTLLYLVMVLGYFFFNNSVIAENPLKEEEITKIAPKENSIDKILFIKNNFEKNKKYTDIENEKTFKNILIGSWFLRPEGGIEFKGNGRFEAQNGKENKSFSGFWEFSNGTLKMSSDNKRWEVYGVVEYELKFMEHRGKNIYGFYIGFDKKICEMSKYLTLDFTTK